MEKQTTKRKPSLCDASSWIVFFAALAAYWATVDPGVSYWDCPEYATCASRLEVGHPPGNPVWMLAMRAATLPFPSGMHAFVINLWSGIFMALAAMLLARIIFRSVVFAWSKHTHGEASASGKRLDLSAAAAAICGGLSFAWCDSAWFSAVEAEVYAMSAFLSALVIWLMVARASTTDKARRSRLLILTAYITGLSLGVHQLNLLCIPALAMIYVFDARHGRGQTWRTWGALLLSFAIIVIILVGMMNGTLTWSATFELFAVNGLHLPYFSGATAYVALTAISLTTAATAVMKGSKAAAAAALFLFAWLSGAFVFKGNIIIGGAVAAAVSAFAIYSRAISREAVLNTVWMAGFILLGYSSFAMLMIRGNSAPPMNEGAPTDIFALSRYISREQYGSKPLLYGATPYSTPMVEEKWTPGSASPDYSRFILQKRAPIYTTAMAGARLHHRSGLLSEKDSAGNDAVRKSKADGYLLSDYSFTRRTSPELDMWFPRITGSSPSMIESYEAWAGMDKASMNHVEVSATIDSLGNPAGKIGADGKRHKTTSWRPTYLQNLRMLLSYQMGYMYFRYLLWNFAGRQNDIPSTGEIDHGNFITGFPVLDDAMLGPTGLMPDYATDGNKGRNVYFCIPLLFGIAGIIALARGGRRARRVLAVTTVLFLMTGLAIVVYLNQTPGEPRERDYSFLGSFMAFAIWIAAGVTALASAAFKKWKSRLPGTAALAASALGIPVLMLAENFDDHDRSGRFETAAYAANILAMQPDGIIFTHGDNFTFPLWYAQEVEQKGKRHSVVDVSYLATPEYVVNLMRQGENGIRFTATPADVAYGAYAFTRVAKDADTTAIPLADALKELYAQRQGAPAFRHSRVRIPGLTASDTLTIDLRALSPGGLIPFKELMLLDILATNMDSKAPKPLYFLSHIAGSFYRPLAGTTRPFAFAEAYAPTMTNEDYLSSLRRHSEALIASGSIGHGHPAYTDPVTTDMSRRQRGALTRTARVFLDNGLTRDAGKCAEAALLKYPPDIIPGASFTVADTTFHEGIELSRLLTDLTRATGERRHAEKATTLLWQMKKRAMEWKRYHAALPPDRRALVSNETRRLILTIPTIDSLLNEIATLNQPHHDGRRTILHDRHGKQQ